MASEKLLNALNDQFNLNYFQAIIIWEWQLIVQQKT